jgi:hypothetical protein
MLMLIDFFVDRKNILDLDPSSGMRYNQNDVGGPM